MSQKINLSEVDKEIKQLKRTSELLMDQSERFPSLEKNTSRILASIKMLEINISDIVELDNEQR